VPGKVLLLLLQSRNEGCRVAITGLFAAASYCSAANTALHVEGTSVRQNDLKNDVRSAVRDKQMSGVGPGMNVLAWAIISARNGSRND
ncbi:hypothetical protein, partial [Paeniglutamicibacter antarcticus]|uniref:hypothetical protein n=1 Tax=Paeniglutamicibacter antarcticus TaxID=494023 RepID=UPI0031EE8DD9